MDDAAEGLSIELVKVGAKGAVRLCRLSIEGLDLVTAAGAAGKPLKVTTRAFADAQAVRIAYEKARREKLRDGFARVNDRERARPGEVVLEAFASSAGSGVLLDLSPDGRFAVTVGSTPKLTAFWVEIIEVATGARRIVYEGSAGTRQGFVHTVLFDATGASVYLAVCDDTLRIDLATGVATTLVAIRDFHTPQFNPHVLRPHLDGARERLVVFDAGMVVRVLDREGRSLLDVSNVAPTSEVRAARISPSGRLLALYRVSRWLIYGHEDARRDTTSLVEVWDIDAGVVKATIPCKEKLDAVSLDPADELLVVSWDYAQGPVAHDLATGEERWRFADPWRTDRLADAYCWAYSPDGSLLAVGRGSTCLHEAATRAEIPLAEAGSGQTARVVFSADGSLLASAEGGCCVVRRVR
jgi:hypothetical protein